MALHCDNTEDELQAHSVMRCELMAYMQNGTTCYYADFYHEYEPGKKRMLGFTPVPDRYVAFIFGVYRGNGALAFRRDSTPGKDGERRIKRGRAFVGLKIL